MSVDVGYAVVLIGAMAVPSVSAPDLPQNDVGGDGYQGRFAPPPAVACGHP